MTGGKSKSSSTSDASQSTISSDGVVTGKVFNISGGQGGADFSYTEQFPQSVADLFTQVLDLAGNAGQLAAQNADKALTATQSLASQAAQPDLNLVKQVSGYVPLILLGAGVVLILILKKK